MRKALKRLSWEAGSTAVDEDSLPVETPVALVYNGISHVVTMATPAHLEDMALGFSLTEGILDTPEQLYDCELVEQDEGLELNLQIASEAFHKLKHRRRNLTGRTGCGLCGVESLSLAIPELTPVSGEVNIEHNAIQRAREELYAQQKPGKSGGVHAAVWCSQDGNIELLREDVGRHNALDKLLGALVTADCSPQGFVLVTSRASYEMIAKVVSRNISILAALSAPTSLAIQLAEASNLTLVAHVKDGRHGVYTHEHRVI